MLTATLGLVLALHPDVLMAAFIPLVISRRIKVISAWISPPQALNVPISQ
jgi:hypothetical protein